MLSTNNSHLKEGKVEFEKALGYAQRASTMDNALDAVKLTNYALNHYMISIAQTILALSDQTDDMSDRLEKLDRARAMGLSTTLR